MRRPDSPLSGNHRQLTRHPEVGLCEIELPDNARPVEVAQLMPGRLPIWVSVRRQPRLTPGCSCADRQHKSLIDPEPSGRQQLDHAEIVLSITQLKALQKAFTCSSTVAEATIEVSDSV